MRVLGRPLSDQEELFAENTVDQVSRNRAETHLGSAEILEDGDLPTGFPTYATNVGEEGGVFLVGPVRKVKSEHVDAGVYELA